MQPPSRPRPVALLLVTALLGVALAGTGCSKAYYAAWEKLGKEKRDLLRDHVVKVRKDEEAASEQFQDALTRLKTVTDFDGGELERFYDKVKGDYDRSVSKADALRGRIDKIESIATDLFAEWEGEIGQISDSNLRDRSRAGLETSRRKYASLQRALRKTEASMDPVLKKFNDQVLFLKHNLNAAAIGGLQGEAADIESEIGKLIQAMQASAREADSFIATLD